MAWFSSKSTLNRGQIVRWRLCADRPSTDFYFEISTNFCLVQLPEICLWAHCISHVGLEEFQNNAAHKNEMTYSWTRKFGQSRCQLRLWYLVFRYVSALYSFRDIPESCNTNFYACQTGVLILPSCVSANFCRVCQGMCFKRGSSVQTVPHVSFENATVQCETPPLASTTIFWKFQTQNQLTNHQPLFCRLNLMRQTLYINMRSRSSLRAERAKTFRITTMATRTFLKTSNNKNPLTSHQLLLRCSQVKSVVT